MTAKTSEMCDAALGYAEVGWPVFPCIREGKVPLANAAPHGFKDATTDLDTIAAWWTRYPLANIAVACGAPGPDVLDVDNKAGRDGLELFRRVRSAGLAREAAAVIRTPSGGWHVWFAGTNQGGGAVGKGKALELKAVGGYVLLPPSYVVDTKYGYAGRYELVERSEGPVGVVDFAAIRRLIEPPRTTYAPRLATADSYKGLVDHVSKQGEGNRNNALFWALCRALETGAGRDVLEDLVNAAVGAGLPRSSADGTLKSAIRRAGGGQ